VHFHVIRAERLNSILQQLPACVNNFWFSFLQ